MIIITNDNDYCYLFLVFLIRIIIIELYKKHILDDNGKHNNDTYIFKEPIIIIVNEYIFIRILSDEYNLMEI